MPDAALHAPPIAAHRLLSDGRSAALVRPDAEIDWWCAPDFDSPPLLWSLLDAEGGSARWRGARMVRAGGHPAGPTAHTIVLTDGARLECWDGLVAGDDEGSLLVRLIRCARAALDVTHELGLGGFDGPRASWNDEHEAVIGTTTVAVDGGNARLDGHRLLTRVQAPAGVWAGLVIGTGRPVPANPDALVERLRAAEAKAEGIRAGARLPRHHPERAADALAVLEACTYRRTGAVIASPTTSLPEAPGADRQFDYRYTWLRDAALAVSVAALLGRRTVAERYLAFVKGLVGPDGVPSGPMVDVRGHPVPSEREVPGIAGWAASRPVRVGNAASDQIQYDALGMLVESVSVYLQTGGALDAETWEIVKAVADRMAGDDETMSNGIWELRDQHPLVSADIGRWLALDRAVWIARGWRPLTSRRHWKSARDRARGRVIDALGDDGGLPQIYGDLTSGADSSALMAAVFGMFDRRDPRASLLVDATVAALEAGPFVYRYEPGGTDGFAGKEGAFLPVSWWAVAALAATGRVHEAGARADEMCASLPRLLAEEVDPETGTGLGNVPLVWSHMEAARALYILDAAALRQRFGPVGLWGWRLARYASLRWGRHDG